MKPLTCAAARRRLHAFYDGELPVADQIAVESHLDWCESCAAALAGMRLIGSTIRLAAPGRESLTHDEGTAFAAAIVSRQKAEQEASLIAHVQRLFDDMHLVYAAVGAAVATLVCVVIALGMMRFANAGRSDRPQPYASTVDRPDSLAAIVDLLATPWTSANAGAVDAASQQRWTARFQAANESAEEETVFALAAMVTRDGQLANLHGLRTNRRKAPREEAALIEELLDAVTRARIEPGVLEGPRTSSNGMVWLVTRTTVRATKIVGVDLPLPPVTKKRTARLNGSAPASA